MLHLWVFPLNQTKLSPQLSDDGTYGTLTQTFMAFDYVRSRNEMIVHKKLKVLLHLSLLVGGWIFCWQNIAEYLKGNTNYLSEYKLLSLNDLPTIVICIEREFTSNFKRKSYEYGRELWIKASVEQDPDQETRRTSILLKDQWVNTSVLQVVEKDSYKYKEKDFGLQLHLSEIHMPYETVNSINGKTYFPQCYKVSSRWNESTDKDVTKFALQLAVVCYEDVVQKTCPFCEETINTQKCNIPDARVHGTSEENSYGLPERKWFDGIVQDSQGMLVKKHRHFNADLLRIIEVTEYFNMDWHCSHESYYECLSKRFKQKVQHNFDNQRIDRVLCPRICSPFSLPPTMNSTIPLCQDFDCRKIMSDILSQQKQDLNQRCMKSCHVKEFKFAEKTITTHRLDEDASVMEIRFDVPASTNSRRIQEPFKIVKNEYLMIDFISLVGVVGGTLGLFAGFSFLGVAEWMVDTFFGQNVCLLQNFLFKIGKRKDTARKLLDGK